jgi:response regulator of citrate/malate metabolism
MKHPDKVHKSVLLVGDDQHLESILHKSLLKRLGVEIYKFDCHQLRDILRVSHPLLFLLVSECFDGKQNYLISWLRDHFHGRPIIVIASNPDKSFIENLHKLGVSLILDREEDEFQTVLSNYIKAVLADNKAQCA